MTLFYSQQHLLQCRIVHQGLPGTNQPESPAITHEKQHSDHENFSKTATHKGERENKKKKGIIPMKSFLKVIKSQAKQPPILDIPKPKAS